MVVPTAKAIDTKREEFRRYLEKEGVLEQLTKTLCSLYEEPEKPSNAVAFISKTIASDDLKALKGQYFMCGGKLLWKVLMNMKS